MTFKILQFRSYDEPKLTKPKELKNVKSIGVSYIPKKCSCPVFFVKSDIYVKHRDYFSPSFKPNKIGVPINNFSFNQLKKTYTE